MKGGKCSLAPRRVQPVCYHAQVWTILDELRSVALGQTFVQRSCSLLLDYCYSVNELKIWMFPSMLPIVSKQFNYDSLPAPTAFSLVEVDNGLA